MIAGLCAALYSNRGAYRPVTAFCLGLAAMLFLFACGLFQFERGTALIFGLLLVTSALPAFSVGFFVSFAIRKGIGA